MNSKQAEKCTHSLSMEEKLWKMLSPNLWGEGFIDDFYNMDIYNIDNFYNIIMIFIIWGKSYFLKYNLVNTNLYTFSR